MEVLIEEKYYFETMKEAGDASDKMRAERACDMGFKYKTLENGLIEMTVELGEAR